MSGNNQSSTGSSTNENSNWSQMGRKLLKPDEVLGLSERIAITFTPGVPPIWTTLVRYYEESLVGRQSGFLQRFQAAAWMLIQSAALLAVSYWIAVSL
jgi:type IV secretion system protein VirD4